MSSFLIFVVAAMLALPPGADSGKANATAQNAPTAAAPPSTAPAGASAQPRPPDTDKTSKQAGKKENKKEKKKKIKKSSCISPPPDSGLPDYCKNPYWEPKDWLYIMNNTGTDPQ